MRVQLCVNRFQRKWRFLLFLSCKQGNFAKKKWDSKIYTYIILRIFLLCIVRNFKKSSVCSLVFTLFLHYHHASINLTKICWFFFQYYIQWLVYSSQIGPITFQRTTLIRFALFQVCWKLLEHCINRGGVCVNKQI